ncbi:hypothetical protein HK405_012044, partial [Cladochytrium tenue]
ANSPTTPPRPIAAPQPILSLAATFVAADVTSPSLLAFRGLMAPPYAPSPYAVDPAAKGDRIDLPQHHYHNESRSHDQRDRTQPDLPPSSSSSSSSSSSPFAFVWRSIRAVRSSFLSASPSASARLLPRLSAPTATANSSNFSFTSRRRHLSLFASWNASKANSDDDDSNGFFNSSRLHHDIERPLAPKQYLQYQHHPSGRLHRFHLLRCSSFRLRSLSLLLSAAVLTFLAAQLVIVLLADPDRLNRAALWRYDACPAIAAASWAAGPMPNASHVDFSTPFDDADVDVAAAVAAETVFYPSPNHFRTCRALFAPPPRERAVGPAAALRADAKYFHEVPALSHSDARFYPGPWPVPVAYNATSRQTRYAKPKQDRAALHAQLEGLFAAWSRFSAHAGVKAWLAHGTLIGWFWSRQVLPWDDDIDLQISLADLDRLADRFNQTIWEARYLVDINPHVSRRYRQRRNVIDARFIDTRSGRFIDLTALASPQAPSALAAALAPPPPATTLRSLQADPDAAAAAAAAAAAEADVAPANASIVVGCKSVHNYTLPHLFPL